MPDQPLAMPQQCPPALSTTPPMTPNESSQPPPLPPLAPPTPQPEPSDVHEFCVPLTIHKALEKDYQALESRLKSVLAENRALRQQAEYYQNVSEAQKDGDVPKRTSDLIFKKRLEPFMSETKADMMVRNLKRPRQYEAEDMNVAGEILSHVSKKGYELVQRHLGGPCRETVKRGFSWLSIMQGIIKPIGRVQFHSNFTLDGV